MIRDTTSGLNPSTQVRNGMGWDAYWRSSLLDKQAMAHGCWLSPSSRATRPICLMLVANAINIAGFTFVIEAPVGEYLEHHPSPFWEYIKAHLRSNADPHGLEVAQITFYICFPIVLAVFIWGAATALKRIRNVKDE